ncbi:MAG TPA: helix-turn-helix domain-containing protein [Solirubrobacteraceae bacterium]|nr:helix-turn-helix domain-containing protein [Solirubrobacteraceae bacterium]
MDYLPDSRILTPADKAERRALCMAFGANLRRARLSAGITQRDLAVRAEFSSATVVSQLEVGTRPSNFLQLVMLGHALDTPHDALLSLLPVPLRERSTRLMLALVRKHPGISADELASALRVKPSYITMLGGRLSLEQRVIYERSRFLPLPDPTRGEL